MRGSPARVLFIEDEAAIRDAVTTALADAGYLVRDQADGALLRDLADGFRPDLAILDITLPGPDGMTLARQLRARSDLPILFLAARDGLDDRLRGFAAGADDYLVKPFALTELLARVHALLRRAGRLHSVTTEAGGREAARSDANRVAAARLPPGPARPYRLKGRAAHPGLGLRLLRPEHCRGPDQFPAAQTRDRWPEDPPHRARARLHRPALTRCAPGCVPAPPSPPCWRRSSRRPGTPGRPPSCLSPRSPRRSFSALA